MVCEISSLLVKLKDYYANCSVTTQSPFLCCDLLFLSKPWMYFIHFLIQSNLYMTSPPSTGQFSKSEYFAYKNAVFFTCIKQPPLLSSSDHSVLYWVLNAIHHHYKEITCTKCPVSIQTTFLMPFLSLRNSYSFTPFTWTVLLFTVIILITHFLL